MSAPDTKTLDYVFRGQVYCREEVAGSPINTPSLDYVFRGQVFTANVAGATSGTTAHPELTRMFLVF